MMTWLFICYESYNLRLAVFRLPLHTIFNFISKVLSYYRKNQLVEEANSILLWNNILNLEGTKAIQNVIRFAKNMRVKSYHSK